MDVKNVNVQLEYANEHLGGGSRHGFQVGMMLEGIDPWHPSLFCVLSIVEVRAHRMRLHFEGYSASFDFWVPFYSASIFPPGWCSQHSKPLQPPKGFAIPNFYFLEFF